MKEKIKKQKKLIDFLLRIVSSAYCETDKADWDKIEAMLKDIKTP